MSTSITHLRRLAQRDVKDHTAIFDLYVTVGRDVEYLSIKFGMDPDDVINLLEGYGEMIRFADGEYDGEDQQIRRSLEEFGEALDYSGKGRLSGLPRVLIEDYIERFYPGIASERPENDWINIESYFDHMHPGWRVTLKEARSAVDDGAGEKKKKHSRFRLFG